MGEISSCSNGINNGNNINGVHGNGNSIVGGYRKSCWYEEEIEENLRWCFALNSILHTGSTQYQEIQLLDTKPFGKALVIDGKLQSAEIDEFIYHESLVHPALLHHPNPKAIFIMGGGEGSTARELLRHNTVVKVVMCDIDEEVVDFCKSYLVVNREAFCDPRLELIINDARAELEGRDESYDVIVGDLADPIAGGPCYKLYTKSFYESVVKPRLNQGGIFVTQMLCLIQRTFLPMLTFGDGSWHLILHSAVSADELDLRMKQRIKGENSYLDGKTFTSNSTLSKAVRKSLDNETHVYTEKSARFIYGHGTAYKHNQD
ncbi:S-adenosyl-L-methionine-dependent methyltransferases superfamily protein [Actinidia rufa]|uniref:thermospermine synthase n=1 Tax=Actinidia rufa TaxID=165716 RepID=A0A7J0HG88_9ERIC|nr:S-adenosyl-L-methionine-dependent methyltransferases superfamily protein [Actinidia rufa]